MAFTPSTWLFPLIARLFPVFEPLLPSYVSLTLRRRLRRWKNEGRIQGYKTRTKRLGKFRYRVSVEIDVSQTQAERILVATTDRLARSFPRNIEEVIG